MLAVSSLALPALRSAYRVQQASLRLPLTWTRALLGSLVGDRAADPEAISALQREYAKLLEADLANVERGAYPASLLFQMPVGNYATRLPWLLLDLPRTYRRFRERAYQDLPDDVDRKRFPAYFRRTFHWQTDGYLSRRSAELYDVGVELLFLGCADVMRRQVIPPMTRFARSHRARPLRLLDVGCGTGRVLSQLATALPEQQYFGVDLSPFYLESARKTLRNVPEVTLVADNAEHLPFRDGYFDCASSVFLFHELPRRARRCAVNEMLRVLKPGGVLVIEDSAQYAEARDLTFFLESFPSQMHEPFYRDYLRDDLGALLADAGFERVHVERAWLSKVVSARKPA